MAKEFNYLIIGDGRVARHIKHYFALLHLPYRNWDRNQHSIADLERELSQASHILILIKDDAIDAFFKQNLTAAAGIKLHFSGNLWSEQIIGAHPLFTFTQQLYALCDYVSIPFVMDSDKYVFAELLPGLPNPSFYLKPEFKKKYHAMCVLAGNFSCLLWQKLFRTFHNEFSLPEKIALPYLKKVMNNLMEQPNSSLTGPLARNDVLTINDNLSALQDDPFHLVYESFLKCHALQQEKK